MDNKKYFYQACGDGDIKAIDSLISRGLKVDTPNPLDGYTGLHYAADRVNTAAVEHLLLVHNADVNKRGPDGATALHWACRSPGAEETIELLLKHGADPNIQGMFGRTPLHVTARKGFVENLRTLVWKATEKKVDINKSDNVLDEEKAGTTALHLAAAHNHVECVRVLLFELDEKADCSKLNSKHQTPLHLACGMADVEIVKMLIEGAGPTAKELGAVDRHGRTPLLHACQNKNVGIVKYLVQYSNLLTTFEINFQNAQGETALHCAASGGEPQIVEILLDGGADKTLTTTSGITPLHVACHQDRMDAVRTFLKYEADLFAKDEQGETPLFKAVHGGCLDMVKLLVEEQKMDVTGHNHAGETPTHIAVKANAIEVLGYLMEVMKGLQNRMEDDFDNAHNSPLHLAALLGHTTCTEILLDHNYKMGRTNKSGYAPVHLAAREGRKKILELMLAKNKDCVAFENKKGNTPLHLAARAGFTFSCRALLEAGADDLVNKVNLDGATALHFAAQSGSKSICRDLLAVGAHVNVQDVNEFTPLHYSAQFGEEATAEMLLEAGASLTLFNELKDNPLLTAIKHNNENVLGVILNCDRWRDAVRVSPRETQRKKSRVVSTYDVKVDFDVLDAAHGKKKEDEETLTCKPLHMLIIHYPDQAKTIFDRCTNADDMISEEDLDYWVQFDYSLIENPAEHDVHPFITMLEHNRIELLDHPLVSSLITAKWEKYGRSSYYLNLLLNALFVISLTCMAVFEAAPDVSGSDRPSTFLRVISLITMVLALVRLVLEVLQAIRNTRNYFRDAINYFEVSAFVFSIIFAMGSFASGPGNFQWEVGCFVTVIAWLNFIFSLTKLPYIGLTIIMTRSVLAKFLSVMLPVLLFILPFALGLFMTLGGEFGTFRNIFLSYSKALVMLTGEINYDMYYIPQSTRDAPLPISFPYSSFVIFHIFLFGMTIMLGNLLIGLAVDDVSETLRRAKLLRSAGRIDQIFLTEKLRRDVLNNYHPEGKIYPNRKNRFALTGNYTFTGEAIEEILSRRRKDKLTDSKKLHRIQLEISRLLENETSLQLQMNYIQNLVEEMHKERGLTGLDSKISHTSLLKAVDRE